MPLLLAYLKSVPTGNTQHLAKACYALENFVENLGSDGSVRYRGGEEHIWLKRAAGWEEVWEGLTDCQETWVRW